jgi:hypothetical protein
MNIHPAQMKAIRALITKEDKQQIALSLNNSVRTIEAVMGCDRANNEIEIALFHTAVQKHAKLSRTIAAIESQNTLPVQLETFIKIKESPVWINDETYQRYNDIYLRLCHFSYTEMSEVWQELKSKYKDIILKGNYCCDLLCRLTGSDENSAVLFYNSNI